MHTQKEPSLYSSGFEHTTLACRKFNAATNRDYWLGTTDIELSMKVSMKWWFH
jgi:hypothetical protein